MRVWGNEGIHSIYDMVTIKEYLGALVNGVSKARVIADLESAEIAKLYAKDELLKNFSIPRFKVADVQLDIPMVIAELGEQTEKGYEPIDNKTFNSKVYQTIKDATRHNSLDRKSSDFLRKTIAAASRELEEQLKGGVGREKSLTRFSTAVSDQFIKNVKANKKNYEVMLHKMETADSDVSTKLSTHLVSSLQDDIKEPTTKINMEEAKVIVESAKLKEYKPENIIRISMKLSEEGLEWQTMEGEDGEIKQKLLPE